MRTRRSEHWLRAAVNKHSEPLNARVRTVLGLAPNDAIHWLSPLADDEFAEYYDEAFLERLEIRGLSVPLSEFWPAGGPRWDGLARTSSGEHILVEAKAYVEEAVDYRSRAGESSLIKIRYALGLAKEAFRASAEGSWERPFYQYANRLAHLHFLRGLNGVKARLLFLYFADAPDVPRPCSEDQWIGAIRLINKVLGLGEHPYQPHVGHLIWSVQDLLSDQSLQPPPAPGE